MLSKVHTATISITLSDDDLDRLQKKEEHMDTIGHMREIVDKHGGEYVDLFWGCEFTYQLTEDQCKKDMQLVMADIHTEIQGFIEG